MESISKMTTATHPAGLTIYFDQKYHVYFDEFGFRYLSGTQFVKRYKQPFDDEAMAIKCSHNPNSKWYDIDPALIMQAWRKSANSACELGTEIHNYIETGKKSKEILAPYKQAKNALNYATRLYGEPRKEVIVFSPRHLIAGTIDALFDSAIVDWKTNAEIKQKNPFQKMLTPFDELDDCNFNHYALQLNLYRYIVELDYGMDIKTMQIFHIQMDKFTCLDIPRIDNAKIERALDEI